MTGDSGGRRLSLVVSSLAMGGTERVVGLLAEALAARQHRVVLITVGDGSGDFFAVPAQVERRHIAPSTDWPPRLGPLARFALRAWRLRRILQEEPPDCVLSFGAMTNVLAVAAATCLAPVIVSERTFPGADELDPVRAKARRWSYRAADQVVAQTERAAAWVRGMAPGARVAIVPNPVGPRFIGGPPAAGREALVLAVGRLAPEKGHRQLCEAWAMVEQAFPEWRLVIVGDGPELGALAAVGGLAERGRLVLPGASDRPEEWMRRAAVFVLPSLREGFPNALLEAMACGCAVVASDCEAGPAELLGGDAGLLVPVGDTAALAARLGRLLADGELRFLLGRRAAAAATAYALDSIVERWESVIEEAIRSHG